MANLDIKMASNGVMDSDGQKRASKSVRVFHQARLSKVSSDRHYVQITGPAAVSQAPAGRHERLSKQLSGRSVVRGAGAEERERGPEDDSGGSRAGVGGGGGSRNNSFRGGAAFRHVVLNIE